MHIGDRVSDIYELLSECTSQGTTFVFRSYVTRRSGGGEETVAEVTYLMQKKRRITQTRPFDIRCPMSCASFFRGFFLPSASNPLHSLCRRETIGGHDDNLRRERLNRRLRVVHPSTRPAKATEHHSHNGNQLTGCHIVN